MYAALVEVIKSKKLTLRPVLLLLVVVVVLLGLYFDRVGFGFRPTSRNVSTE
jgi:hypothetical protein